MSGIGGADQPPVKKLKHGDDTETGTNKFGGPVEDEATARKKLKEVGFDPDNVNDVRTYAFDPAQEWDLWTAAPMGHFCRAGDLPMCRYLLAKGASITKACDSDDENDDDDDHDDDDDSDDDDDDEAKYCSFPMMAAVRGGQLDVCKWLYNYGAASGVSRRLQLFGNHKSSLWFAARSGDEGYFEIGKWLILKGALCVSKGSSNVGDIVIDTTAMAWDMFPRFEGVLRGEIPNIQADTRRMYLSWAEGAIIDHRIFFTFLCGASLKAPQYSEESLRAFLDNKLCNASATTILVEDMPEEKQRRIWNVLTASPVRALAGNI